MQPVDCTGYLVRGTHRPAIVVATKQGLLAQRNDDDALLSNLFNRCRERLQ